MTRRLMRWMLLAMMGCPSVMAATGQATLRGTADGSPMTGTATFTDTPNGLQIAIQVANVPPGPHGLHIHQFGSCADVGKAAGGHYNPTGAPHGYLPKDGSAAAHAGDFGNVQVGADGAGTLELVIPNLSLNASSPAAGGGGPYPVAGRAVIVHEKMDDFGQPTGNAGGRIACGPIVLTGE